MPLLSQHVHRYNTPYGIQSILDPYDDVLTLVESLTSIGYLLDIITQRHHLTMLEAKARAKTIIPHIRTAIQYIYQSTSGPQAVSFLPSYYAMLNLSKVYILLGQRHASLPSNRLHGIQYKGFAKDSQSILTEQVTLHTKGAFPLFYETLTGVPFRGQTQLSMSDVYPYIVDISAEYALATGKPSQLATVAFDLDLRVPGAVIPTAQLHPIEQAASIDLRKVKLLKDFQTQSRAPFVAVGPRMAMNDDHYVKLRDNLRPFLLYHSHDRYYTPLSSKRLLLPEELPIIVAFFHLSSIVRYKPEFLAKVKDSRYWPMLSAAQRHCVLKFMILFWSFMHQETLTLDHG